MVNRWRPPLQARRSGAAHLRRGRPCQDAVAVGELRSRDGQPVQLMAVADGHGGERYIHSAEGSRLACSVALAAVERRLRAGSLPAGEGPELEAWVDWLAVSLPHQIQHDWLAVVQRHWLGLNTLEVANTSEARPSEAGSSETSSAAAADVPLLYGTTLGLVLMAPGWWGFTGLGDWDLVRIDAAGQGELLSEEPSMGGGEATGSLCLERAAEGFRSGLTPIRDPDRAFALVLSSDGIRKSCATDADFLALASHLASTPALTASDDLAACLDQISREGSGDDVTVAIGHWGGSGRLTEAQPAADPAPAAPQRRSRAIGLAALALVVVMAGLAWGWLGLRQRSQTGRPAAPLAAEITRLCSSPAATIGGTLSGRRSQFSGLRQGTLTPAQLLASAQLDPLGALIASSFDPGSGGMVQGPSLRALALCPDLAAALRQQWQAGPVAADPKLKSLPSPP